MSSNLTGSTIFTTLAGLFCGDMPRSAADRDTIARLFAEAALDAAAAIMAVYATDFDVDTKADASPVTEADQTAHRIIVTRLAEALPDIPVVSEEEAGGPRVPEDLDAPFILVDPLDGTREFINRNGEFTVNIALIEDRTPMAGVVYAPVLSTLYMAGDGASLWRIAPGGRLDHATAEPIQTRSPDADSLIAVASRSHRDDQTNDFLASLNVAETRARGSSLKFCLVAAGEADVYPRFGPTMEWDTAAGDAVVRAAGGVVATPDGNPFRYGKPDFRNGAFIAWGRRP